MIFAYLVTAKDQDTRIDTFLVAQRELALSRNQAQRLIQRAGVEVNGKKPRKTGLKLKVGDMVRVHLPQPREHQIQAEDIPLCILYEDVDLLVLDKPAGMVVHPAPGHYSGTLVNALLKHCGELPAMGDPLRPGIVHRLDKDTSGLLIVSKTKRAYRGLVKQLKLHLVNRTYQALVKGRVKIATGVVTAPIGRNLNNRKKMAVVASGKRAVTHFRVLEKFPAHSLLELKLETGRTHQIRVHLSYMGHPIVGDVIYGGNRGKSGIGRQALHAIRLEFVHPISGEELSFFSPLPPDMEELLAKLRS
ncbi:MAG: RluA family pseudouridine synthase [Firmicutes bacterium]|nr:RluA family pseudouridine synthase [Bacillota bacterium]